MSDEHAFTQIPAPNSLFGHSTGDVPRARLKVDLSADLRFSPTELTLTPTHLRARRTSESEPYVERELSQIESMREQEHASLCQLDIHYADGSQDQFRFTVGLAKSARLFVETFEALKEAPIALGDLTDEPSIDERETTSTIAPFWRLLGFTRSHSVAVFLGLLLTFAATAVGLVPSYLTMPLVDKILVPYQTGVFGGTRDQATQQVAYYLGLLFASAALAWLLAWAQGWVLARVAERVTADLRNRTFSHLHRLSLNYFGGKRTGDLITRISTDTERLCSFFSDTLVDFITDILMIVGTVIILFVLDPGLAIATVLSFPPIAVLILRVRGRLNTGFLGTGRAWSAMTSLLTDSISGIRVVKAFSQEKREEQRFTAVNRRILEVNDRINALWTFFWPMVALLNQLGLLVVWAVGAYQVFSHRVTVGVLTAFVAYISRFYTRLETMSRMLASTQRAAASAQRLFEILDRKPSVAEPESPRTLPNVRGEITIRDASFRYTTRLVLDHVNLTIHPGEMIGVVGATGSGKSTLANLICRFYDATEGQILVDGVDLREVPLAEYRRHLGVVLQDPYLFFGSIAENIAYGRPDANRNRILEAARAARAHEFLLRLPDAYDSLAGERGQSLSGGERQRVSIARAILVDPKILVLDEATSAIDVRTEREIQRAIDRLVQGRTTIAIAHRLSTLERADRIVVFHRGRIVETGTPAELLAQNGAYADLVRAQQQPGAAPIDAAIDPQDLAIDDRDALIPLTELTFRAVPNSGLFASHLATGRDFKLLPIRCFPLTAPLSAISLVDERGHEVCYIDDLASIEPTSRLLIETELAAREFRPVVHRILHISVRTTHSEWHVSTDRGAATFSLEDEEQVRALGDGRYVIVDQGGTRFLIPDAHKLDKTSRRALYRFA
jgi:ATP-binding cassette, subfamily B, bacterial